MPAIFIKNSGITFLKINPLQHYLLLALLTIFTLSACVKDKFDDIEAAYTGTLAFPVATVGFTLAEALEGDTTLTVGSDNGISLIYRDDNFFSISAQELLDDVTGGLDESFSKTTKIGQVAIADVDEHFVVPFSDLVEDFNNQSLKQMLEQNDGSMLPIPAFQESLNSEIDVPAFADFSYLEIAEGTMALTLTNDLFIDLQNFTATIIDNTSGQTIGAFQFDYLATGNAQTRELNLQGKTISNDLKVAITSLNSPGSGGAPVMIDLSENLKYELDVRNVSIEAGEVVLQPGVLAQDELQIQLNTDNGEKIYRIVMNDVNVSYSITSEVKTPIRLKLTFPDILKNNTPVTQEITVAPGGPLTGQFDFSNTVWQLDQDAAQPFNRLDVSYEVVLENMTGSQVQFSSDDAVNIDLTVNNLDVEEVTGHFGFREEAIDEGKLDLGVDFGVFAPGSSPLIFDNPKMRIEVANSFGIPLRADFNAEAQGYFGAQASLDPPKLAIGHPSMNQMGETVASEFLIFKNNSNIVEMLSIYPSEIQYGGSVTINPANDLQAVNFIRSNSQLTASAEIDLPFKFKAQDLIFRDTGQALELGLDEGLTIDDIDSATLKINYLNGMPLLTTIRIIALGADGNEQVVLDGVSIDAASVNNAGKVTAAGKATGELFVSLSQEQIRQLDSAAENIYEIRFQTANGGQTPVAMYTDYDVELKIGMTVKFDK